MCLVSAFHTSKEHLVECLQLPQCSSPCEAPRLFSELHWLFQPTQTLQGSDFWTLPPQGIHSDLPACLPALTGHCLGDHITPGYVRAPQCCPGEVTATLSVQAAPGWPPAPGLLWRRRGQTGASLKCTEVVWATSGHMMHLHAFI